MGIFSNFFSKQSKSEEPAPKKEEINEQIQWSTNAPSHWPVLTTDPLPISNPENSQQQAINELMFMARLSEALKNSNCECELSAVAQKRLTAHGILNIPIEVTDKGQRRAIFVYPSSSQENAGHFFGAAKILEERGEPTPVYFAPSILVETSPVSPVTPFSSSSLSKAENAPQGQYAMWWPTEKDSSFIHSRCFNLIKAVYNNLNGINTYVFAEILRNLELVKEDVGRAALPDDGISLPLQGPENVIILFSASQEKGIRFHFHTEKTPATYRDNFWKVFAEYTQAVKTIIEENKAPKDTEDQESGTPIGWWSMVEQLLTKEKPEEGEKVQLFGSIEVNAE